MPVCKKCQEEFKNHIEIDGKKRNLQKRKYCLTCSPFGEHNTRQIEKQIMDTKVCYKCKIEKDNSQFHKKGDYYKSYCKLCSSKVSKLNRIKKREAIFAYTGTTCSKCGYDKCIEALDFHHKDPAQKEFQISRMGNMSLSKILKEIDKCILVCSNCHREIHAGL